MLKPGTQLNNGAVVALSSDLGDEYVVLAYWNGHTRPWVTWKVDKELNAAFGRYHTDQLVAINDYKERGGGIVLLRPVG